MLKSNGIHKLKKFYMNLSHYSQKVLFASFKLKGFYTFNIFQMFPAENKALADKINTTIEKELSKFGIMKRKELVVKTDKGDAVDVSILTKAYL